MPIQLFVPTFDVEGCLQEVRECLERGWTGLGYKSIEFEQVWRQYTGFPHAHFINSNTSGLHLALEVFKEVEGWQDGDEVITSPLTFVSSNHAILYSRMKPVFADVDEYLCLDPQAVERAITARTRAIMFIGIGGNSGRIDQVKAICEAHNLRLILDAAHMAGTRLNGETPGGDATVYSFQAVKNLPTADSGMICFASKEHDEICRKMSWMGINKDTYARSEDRGSYKWLYDVEYVGYKYNGNAVMAGIGMAQLRRLDDDNARRREIAAIYQSGFAGDCSVGSIQIFPGCESSRHLFQIEVDGRDELMVKLNEVEIYPGVHYRDNREYRMFKQDEDKCPNSTRLSSRIISLPMHLRLQDNEAVEVVERVREFVLR